MPGSFDLSIDCAQADGTVRIVEDGRNKSGRQESQPNSVADDLRMNLFMCRQRFDAVEGAIG